eukprot:4222209-Karenia_brevis.AAC.1
MSTRSEKKRLQRAQREALPAAGHATVSRHLARTQCGRSPQLLALDAALSGQAWANVSEEPEPQPT